METKMICTVAGAAYLILINLTAFAEMGIDKSRAKNNRWRIRERTLFLTALIGGALGSLLGMAAFRHKTKHASFCVGMPLLLAVNVVCGCLIWYFLSTCAF